MFTHMISRCRALFVSIAIAASGTGPSVQAQSFPDPPPDDNGERSFARQVVPMLLGRRAKGSEEVELLADIGALLGREAVIRVLMEQPEFVHHWTSVLIDDLRVQREGIRRQSGECFGEPMRANAATAGGGLAEFVRATAPELPSDNVADPYNMTDLIMSAIQLDDLSPIYRAYLFSLVMHPGREFDADDTRRRANVGQAFSHVYLNRQLGCLECHNAEFSVSGGEVCTQASIDAGTCWDRTHPIPVGLDRAMFGESSVTLEGEISVYNLFRTDVRADDGDASIPPWDMDARCHDKRERTQRFVGFQHPPSSTDAAVDFAALEGDDITVFDLDARLRSGLQTLRDQGLVLTAQSGGQLPSVEPAAGLAFKLALTVVDQIWEQVYGGRLTISNYFPRNAAQRDALWTLTEDAFVANRWSLKELLVTMLTRDYFNRKAPEIASGASPYTLPMVIDPWVERDPGVPDEEFDDPNDPKMYNNGQGELVRRYSPHALVSAARSALGWPPARRLFVDDFETSASYLADEDVRFAAATGHYLSDNQPGTSHVDFQGLLSWEARYAGCRKPRATIDWIDRLVKAIANAGPGNKLDAIRLSDVVITMKDWLIQEPWIDERKEAAALEEFFGVELRTVAVDSMSEDALERKLRGFCGILLESPQFMLAGVSPVLGTGEPRLRVCNKDSPCRYEKLCPAYTATLNAMNAFNSIGCLDRDVYWTVDPGSVTMEDIERFCPRGQCDLLDRPDLYDCLLDPRGCVPHVPRCDPTCGRRGAGGCCTTGWPVDWRDPLVALAYAEDAEILLAEDVLVRGAREGAFTRLEKGRRLKFGDTLLVPGGARLTAEGPRGTFSTPDGGMPSPADTRLGSLDRALLGVVASGNLKAAQVLLDAGANPNAADASGRTALMLAARKNDLALTRRLLDSGADLNARDHSGFSALAAARVAGSARAARWLASRGAVLTGSERRARAMPAPKTRPWIMLVTGPSRLKAPPIAGDRFVDRLQLKRLVDAGKLGGARVPLDEFLARWNKRPRPGPRKRDAAIEAMRRMNADLERRGPVDGVW